MVYQIVENIGGTTIPDRKIDKSTIIKDCTLYFSDLRNLRRNFVDELDKNGWTRTLSWIFNWKVPKVAHPSPMDVALNNYSHYATKMRSNHRRKFNQHQNSKWSRRKRKPATKTQKRQRQQLTSQQLSQHSSQLSFQQRSSSSVVKSQQSSQPYSYEQPLSYYDASQVYFYPSQKSN